MADTAAMADAMGYMKITVVTLSTPAERIPVNQMTPACKGARSSLGSDQHLPDHPFEDAGGLEHPDDCHHRGQQQDHIEVEGPLGGLEADEMVGRQIGDEPEHRHCGEDHQDAVGLLQSEQHEHPHQHQGDDALGDRIGRRFHRIGK